MRTSTIVNARDYRGANILPVRLNKSKDQPSESKKVSPCARRLRRSVSQFFSPPGVRSVTKAKKIILDDQRDHRGQDAAYRIAEAPEEGREHQYGDGEEEQPMFFHHNRSHLTSDAPA